MKTMFKRKEQEAAANASDQQAKSNTKAAGAKLTNLLSMEQTVIEEVSEAEENNTTQLKLGRLLLSESKSDNITPKQ